MGTDFLPYVAIVLTMGLSAGLVLAILVLNALLGPKRRNPVKERPFECGNPPADSPRKRFNVKYYVVAIAFVAFDIEAVFLFPWAVMYRDLLKDPAFAGLALAEAVLFIGVLALGLWAIWRKGALEWAFDRTSTGGADE